MYSELYAAWKAEMENPALQPLTTDFYARVSSYLQKIRARNQDVDRNSVESALLDREQRNVNRMVRELLRTRYKKLLKTLKGGQKLLPEILANEEAELFNGLLPFAEAYRNFARGLMRGQPQKTRTEPTAAKEQTAEPSHKRVAVRFVKAIPAIVGSDMLTYGPFQPEDVASVPAENAKMLVKQGLAQNIEVS